MSLLRRKTIAGGNQVQKKFGFVFIE